MRRTLLAALASAAAGALLVLPAAASDRDGGDSRPEEGVSLDGIHFQESLDRPLFDEGTSWAPGDAQVSRFWIRHPESGDDLVVDLDPGERAALVADGRLAVAARSGTGPWRKLRPGQGLRVPVPELRRGQAGVPVAVRVSLTVDAPRATVVVPTDFALTVSLDGELVAGERRPVAAPDEVDVAADSTWWVVPLGLLLLAGGALVLGRREQERPFVSMMLPGDR